ncbi:hypothetical protein [Kitasatospora sp. NPDC057500]|uniref:hypothetical protein n=1 Tax=Kitasatospora sp. NPDC057500 TaxID=3346151 RepID=UPI0036AF5DAC
MREPSAPTTVTPLDPGSVGNFPYEYESPSNYFTLHTWEYLDHLVANRATEHVPTAPSELVGPLTSSYYAWIEALAYELSTADEKALVEARLSAQEAGISMVKSYEGVYGEVTSQQMGNAQVDTKVDYIAGYKLVQWAGEKGLRLSGEVLQNLRDHLPYAPPSADQVIPAIVDYLRALKPVWNLMEAGCRADAARHAILKNLTAPSSTNGGQQVEDDKKKTVYKPALKITTPVQTIRDNLASDNGFAISSTFKDFSERQAEFWVKGEGGGTVNVFNVLSISPQGKASYSVTSLNTEARECTVDVTYKGVTGVAVEPAPYRATDATGWFATDQIHDALVNGEKDTSGWVLRPYPAAGEVSWIKYLVLSAFPTIKITYREGKQQEEVKAWSVGTKVDISLFGIPLGSIGSGYKVTEKTGSSQEEGFTITFGPAPEHITTIYDRRAYVIGAGVGTIPRT